MPDIKRIRIPPMIWYWRTQSLEHADGTVWIVDSDRKLQGIIDKGLKESGISEGGNKHQNQSSNDILKKKWFLSRTICAYFDF